MPFYYFMIGNDNINEINYPAERFIDSFRKRSLEIKIFNVPKGEAIVLTYKKKAILIDGGQGQKLEHTKLGKKLRCFLKNKQVKLQAIILSHNHQDHSNAIGSMLKGDRSILQTNTKFYHQNEDRDSKFYKKMMKRVSDKRLDEIPINAWEKKNIPSWKGSTSIKLFCGPQTSGFYRSILVRFTFGSARFLFTGDIDTKPTEVELIKKPSTKRLLQNIDLLKITHHGSHNGTGKKFLDTVTPFLFFTSSSADGKHDFSYDVEKRIKNYVKRNKKKFGVEYFMTIFNTQFEGDLIIRTDGNKRTLEGIRGILFEVETDSFY